MGYATQIRSKQAQVSTARLIAALGINKYNELMAEVNKKAPPRTHLLDDSKLTEEENKLLEKCMNCLTWKEIGKVLKRPAPQTMFANLAYRRLKNL